MLERSSVTAENGLLENRSSHSLHRFFHSIGAAFCGVEGCCFGGAGARGGGDGQGGVESSHVSMRERTEVRVCCGRSSEEASSSRLSGSTEASEISRCGTGDRVRFIVVLSRGRAREIGYSRKRWWRSNG